MNLLFVSLDDPAPWRAAAHHHLPDANFFVWDEDDFNPMDIGYALVWKPPSGVLASLPNLKAIFNLGAGIDALLKDETLPRHIRIVRLVDPLLTSGMVEYIVHWVLHFHRNMSVYAHQQMTRKWTPHMNSETAKRRIGILGFGELGAAAAGALMPLGFKSMAGWSRTRKKQPGIESFVGATQLKAFLKRTDILVCLLPETEATRGILNGEALAHLPRGAFIINAGRGSTIDDEALMAALKSGHIQCAALDVFNIEPLPSNHPYWDMESVFVTPHIASITTAKSAMAVIATGIDTLESGGVPENSVNIHQGY